MIHHALIPTEEELGDGEEEEEESSHVEVNRFECLIP